MATPRTAQLVVMKEDSEGLIESRRYFLENDLNHLNEGRDDEDERQRLQILEVEGIEDEHLYEVGDDCRQRQHESDGSSHTQRCADFLAHSQERTDAEELGKDDIVDEYRGYEYQ